MDSYVKRLRPGLLRLQIDKFVGTIAYFMGKPTTAILLISIAFARSRHLVYARSSNETNPIKQKGYAVYRLDSKTYDKELNGAVSVAHLAGSMMLRYYDLDYEVSTKAGNTPAAAIVTEVDVTIDHMVRDYFTKVWPDDQLLTEETDPDADWYRAQRIWTIDPIDGTMGYARRTGSFGVSIALIEEGRPVVGVLYAPARNLLAWAVAGEGASLNGIHVDLSNRTSTNTIVISSNSIDLPAYQDALQALNPDGRLAVTATESVVVKALRILKGDGEIYPILPASRTGNATSKFWDVAGADIILHEADARVTDFAGQRYRYDRPEFRCLEGVLMGTKAGHRYALTRLGQSAEVNIPS